MNREDGVAVIVLTREESLQLQSAQLVLEFLGGIGQLAVVLLRGILVDKLL
jgi:hypothetical protein